MYWVSLMAFVLLILSSKVVKLIALHVLRATGHVHRPFARESVYLVGDGSLKEFLDDNFAAHDALMKLVDGFELLHFLALGLENCPACPLLCVEFVGHRRHTSAKLDSYSNHLNVRLLE